MGVPDTCLLLTLRWGNRPDIVALHMSAYGLAMPRVAVTVAYDSIRPIRERWLKDWERWT